MNHILDRNKYARLARQAAAEGCVLLKNDRCTLPLRDGDRVAVFGRHALHYYKSGLGSGGMVHTEYAVSILDALRGCSQLSVDETLLHIYEEWTQQNPVDWGKGWGEVPWAQKEMPLTDEMVETVSEADVAIVIIGRTAGEDQDNTKAEGSYLLTATEKDMLDKVCKAFKRTAVLLNVGNIIDMNWVEEWDPGAVMYVWQGGQEGGNGVVDVLTGKVNPCGKLTDTIAYGIEDYPSTENFGDRYKNYYKEDIYVGYRYFETFAKEKVQYPFGFGLSYTNFTMRAKLCAPHGKAAASDAGKVTVKVSVTNMGTVPGKEVVQVYVRAPQGVLGKPARVLAGFAKTQVLQPGETEELTVECPKKYFASYDDSGRTGHKNCFVLEAGKYSLYVGGDVRCAAYAGSWQQETEALEQLEEACAPVEEFERLKAVELPDGTLCERREPVPLRTVKTADRRKNLPGEAELTYTGDRGYVLKDVYEGRVTMDAFVAQLSDEDLICMFRGEGMCSPKVTPGTAGAFGGLTESLRDFGIPAACCADGPSGIRMDCGTKAFLIPNGTALGCSFNTGLVEELFRQMGRELCANRVDTLLGPGINIHRNPLNGRNFEYISEDPLLTGKIGVAQLTGMHPCNVTGTIKHFAANNQEKYRSMVEAVVSGRALREIYLRPFELCVKEGHARSVMTTYGPVNGIWTAGNYELCTTILREQWGFDGIVMTDWWAVANWEGKAAEQGNRAPMVHAQNDLYMCCPDTQEASDNVREQLANGELTRFELCRNAKNILSFLLKSPALHREPKVAIGFDCGRSGTMETGEDVFFDINITEDGEYSVCFCFESKAGELAQIPVSIYVDGDYRSTFSLRGTDGKQIEGVEKLGKLTSGVHLVNLRMSENGQKIKIIALKREVGA